jgi:hypothetical protein
MPEKMGKGDYDYASMVWIRDKDGKEYACYLDDIKGKIKTKEELTDEEKSAGKPKMKSCMQQKAGRLNLPAFCFERFDL